MKGDLRFGTNAEDEAVAVYVNNITHVKLQNCSPHITFTLVLPCAHERLKSLHNPLATLLHMLPNNER